MDHFNIMTSSLLNWAIVDKKPGAHNYLICYVFIINVLRNTGRT